MPEFEVNTTRDHIRSVIKYAKTVVRVSEKNGYTVWETHARRAALDPETATLDDVRSQGVGCDVCSSYGVSAVVEFFVADDEAEFRVCRDCLVEATAAIDRKLRDEKIAALNRAQLPLPLGGDDGR